MIDGEGHIGRVFGNRVMEIRFRTPGTEKLQVGEMLVVEDESSETMYLVRTMDIEHGADMEAPDWMEREAGLMLHKDSSQEKVVIDNLLDRLYKVGVSTPLGYIENNVFHKTKSIPTHFSRVRRTSSEDYDFLKQYLGDVEVGHLRSGDRVLDLPVGFSGRAMPYHIGIFATTGMGKSNLMKNLALSCMKLRQYGFLIFDPHGEYYDGGEAGKKGLRHVAFKDGLEVFSSRKLDGPYNSLRISAMEIEIDDLANLYEFTQPQLECLQAAQWKYGNRWLLELNQKEVSAISQDLQGRFHEGSINVIKRRLDNIFRFELITTDEKFSITSNILNCLQNGKVVLIDTSNMFEAEELLVSTVLTRAIFERNKSLYADKEKFDKMPPLLIAMEEAQRVLSQAKGHHLLPDSQRGAQVQGRPMCHIAAAEADQRGDTLAVQHPLHPRAGGQARPGHPAQQRQAGHLHARQRDPDADAGRDLDRITIHPVRGAGEDPFVRRVRGSAEPDGGRGGSREAEEGQHRQEVLLNRNRETLSSHRGKAILTL